MEDNQLAFTMHAVLLATLVAVSHWGPLELSSAQDRAQCCCTELEKITKAFPEVYECLVEDCTMWLTDMRASTTLNETSCPVPENVICEKFAGERASNVTTVPNRTWPNYGQLTVSSILRVVDSQSWQNCLVIYDANSWPILHFLTSSLSSRYIDFIVYDALTVNGSSELKDMLRKTFNDLNIKNIIVMTHVVFADKLFREAEAYDTSLGRTSSLRMFTKWIVTTCIGFEERIAKAAAYFDNVVAITEKEESILSTSSGSSNKTIECMRTDVSTLMYVSNNSREFQSIVVLLPSGDLIVNDSFPNTRNGFNTRTLLVGTKTWRPFIFRTTDTAEKVEYSGMCIDLLNELAINLNFTYEFVEPPYSEGWGSQNGSGHWEGLVGLLHRQDGVSVYWQAIRAKPHRSDPSLEGDFKWIPQSLRTIPTHRRGPEEVDVVVAPMSFSTERALAMDSTYPWTTNYLAVIYKKPDPDLEKWLTYLRPFRGEVLVCLGITLILVTCLVHVMAWIHPETETVADEKDEKRTGGRQDKEDTREKKKQVPFPGPSPDDGFWYMYGALLSQGGMRLPKSSSGRMLVASWWLFSIVMSATYSGNLIAFLTVQLQTKPFHTLQELLHQNDYVWGVVPKTTTSIILQDSKSPILKELGRKMMDFAASDPEILSLDEETHLQKVKNGGYAYISDSVVSDAWTRENCDFDQIIDRNDASIPFTVNLPKGSGFTHLFSECVMRIVEAGLIKKWMREWFADSQRCVKSVVTESPEITVLDVQSILYALLVGFGLALIVLAVEFLCHRHPKLFSWLNIRNSCCKKEMMGPSDAPSGQRNSHADNRKSARSEFQGVFVVTDGRGEKETALGFFDFESTERRNHFLFSTAYSKPDDFGRVPKDIQEQSRYSIPEDFGRAMTDTYQWTGRDTTESNPVRIPDDVKITT